jgi:excisionase family DNA binding protein
MSARQHAVTGGTSPYLLVEDVAERLRCSIRTIHELTRTNSIPHRRLPGSRRCLFRPDELEAWENGSPLDVTGLPRGGRVVTPRLTTP